MGDGGRLSSRASTSPSIAGRVVNPDRVRSQMEGAVIMGVGLATSAEISFKNGRAQQNNFDTYELTRMDSAPREIRVHLLPAADYARPLGGVGEPGLPPVAPAIANAVFAATGQAHPAAADPRPAEHVRIGGRPRAYRRRTDRSRTRNRATRCRVDGTSS